MHNTRGECASPSMEGASTVEEVFNHFIDQGVLDEGVPSRLDMEQLCHLFRTNVG
jgi:hypothetical protein